MISTMKMVPARLHLEISQLLKAKSIYIRSGSRRSKPPLDYRQHLKKGKDKIVWEHEGILPFKKSATLKES